MPPTLYNIALGTLLGLALLGAALDRRSLAIVALAAALPDLDAVVSLVVEGATNAVFHTLLLPGVVFVLVLWDTMFADRSWIMERYGWWGARTAWVALASFVVAGIVPDLLSDEGVNLLFPFVNQFYAVDGTFYYSTTEGIVQTFVGLGDDRLVAIDRLGSTSEHHVPTWVNPTPGTGLATGEARTLRIVDSGWQLVVVLTAAAATAVRFWEGS